jgi:hypothetical protein
MKTKFGFLLMRKKLWGTMEGLMDFSPLQVISVRRESASATPPTGWISP